MLLAARYLSRYPRPLHHGGDSLADLLNLHIARFTDLRQPRGDRFKRFGLQLLKRQQLHLVHIFVHADPFGERRVNIHRLFGDAATFFGAFDIVQRAHIVQPVGKLHQQHADIVGNRQQKLAQILRRALILGLRLDL